MSEPKWSLLVKKSLHIPISLALCIAGTRRRATAQGAADQPWVQVVAVKHASQRCRPNLGLDQGAARHPLAEVLPKAIFEH